MSYCFIGGCTRNCASYLDKVFFNTRKISTKFEDVCVIIAYDESNDGTYEKLVHHGKYFRNFFIITFDHLLNGRIENLTRARNSILEKIRFLTKNDEYYQYWEYFIMMDMDNVCSGNMDVDILDEYINRYDWDCLSFNRREYYDIFALSYEPYVYSCWHWGSRDHCWKVVTTMHKDISDRLANLPADELMDCFSAFNGFAIYRVHAFDGCFYEHTIPDLFFEKDQIEENERLLGMKIISNKSGYCEHVLFHINASKNNGAQIKISTKFIFTDNIFLY
jgi:hypothetical protein